MRDGITPAHAGKRRTLPKTLSSSQDHPRACGEKEDLGKINTEEWGSPPRMRGKVVAINIGMEEEGITPAHAGKSGEFFIGHVAIWDHPRACGEK